MSLVVLRVPSSQEGTMMLALKRVYDDAKSSDGARFLVERLWPRGIRKSELPMDGWLKDAAPSDRLRKWFAHDPGKWKDFQRRYTAELQAHPDAWAPILEAAKKGQVTLLYSARDQQHNNAVALRDFVERKLER